MAKKDKKAKVDKKARTAAKAEKASKKGQKKSSKKKEDDSDSDDQDIDAILEEYARKQAEHLAVHESAPLAAPPPVRSNALVAPNPSNSKEIFLYGGELYSGNPPTVKFFNDLYVYHTERNEWREITSGNSPMPRSGAAITQGGQGKGELWLFGGEFSSLKQGVFYHYADFWRLDTEKREWQRVDVKGGPTGRSGHRMTYWKNYIALFGGFQSTSPTTTKYLNDLYLFDVSTHTWHSIPLPAQSHIPYPPARSSFSFLPHDAGAVIFGGYSRVKITAKDHQQQQGKKKQGRSTKVKDIPCVHTDCWLLKIAHPGAEDASAAGNDKSGSTAKASSGKSAGGKGAKDAPTARWERRKKPGNIPNPTRVGVTMAHHRGRGVMYGGVYDEETTEEKLDSQFFNEMWVWGIVPNRFFEAKLRKSRRPAAKAIAGDAGGAGGGGGGSKRDRAKADELELLKNLALLEEKTGVAEKGAEGGAAGQLQQMEKQAEEARKAAEAQLDEVTLTLPSARFNSALAVQNDVLYMYGGTFEKGDVEITYDEMYKVNLEKLDGCTTIFKRDPVVAGELEESEDDEEEDDEGSDEGYSEEGTEEEEEQEEKKFTPSKRKPKLTIPSEVSSVVGTEAPPSPTSTAITEPDPEPTSTLPMPLPFETLREYALRTTSVFQALVVESGAANMSVKEVKTAAFEKSEARWWEAREEVRAREEELEELGVGEGGAVMMMTGEEGAGAGGGGGAGRRR